MFRLNDTSTFTFLRMDIDLNKRLWDLIEKGRAVSATGTRLHCAASPRTAHALIVLGADIESVNLQGHTPLQAALADGRRKVAIQLLEDGALGCGTALIRECATGDVELVRLLLASGVSAEFRGGCGASPLRLAVESGHTGVVRLLLEAGANVDDTGGLHFLGRQPLHVASLNGRVEIVRLLIASGAAVDEPDHAGWSPLGYATNHYQIDVVKILLAAGANPHKKTCLLRTPAERTTRPTVRALFGV